MILGEGKKIKSLSWVINSHSGLRGAIRPISTHNASNQFNPTSHMSNFCLRFLECQRCKRRSYNVRNIKQDNE